MRLRERVPFVLTAHSRNCASLPTDEETLAGDNVASVTELGYALRSSAHHAGPCARLLTHPSDARSVGG